MFPVDADLIIGELTPPEAPSDRWCDTGHQAPFLFRRDGALTEALPTRFFLVRKRGSDRVLHTIGTYCEPCMIVAQYMRAQKRKREQIEGIGSRVANGKLGDLRQALTGLRGTKL